MSIFNKHKQPAPPKPLTNTETLRHQLTARIRRRALISIAGDINDIAITAANRVTAKSIASKMAADAPDVAASIARTLVGGFGSKINRDAGTVSDIVLQTFVDGGDLPAAVKAQIAEYLSGGFQTYDAEGDRLKSTNTAEPATYGHPVRWTHPDKRIEETRKAYHAALAAVRHR